jgi:hypothetical protein
MARIRIILEDDDGREINGDKERLYDLSRGTKRLVDIETAVEGFKQAALPELTAELLTLAQHQFVAEVKKGASCDVMGRGASPSRPCMGPLRSWSSGSSAPAVGRPPIWS